MDIDQRNSVLSNHLKGRSKSPGKVAKIATLSQFDYEVKDAYKSRFTLKRLYGLLDVSSTMDKWIGYSNYGTPKHGSAFALAMGQRDWVAHCYHFTLDTNGEVVVRYRSNELSDIWLPAKDNPAIKAFSSEAPDTIQQFLDFNPPIKDPCDWPERETIKKNIMRDSEMTDQERREWQNFFDNVPTLNTDFKHEQCCNWTLPQLFRAKQQWREQLTNRMEPNNDQISDALHEIWVHPGNTASDLKRSRQLLIQARQQKQAALAEKVQAKKMRKRRSNAPPARSMDDDEDDAGQNSDSEQQHHESSDVEAPDSTKIACKNSVVSIGDFVLISPDKESREKDAKSGYTLGLNIGKVHAIDQADGLVEIWWYFAKSWDGDWIPWRFPKTKDAYRGWMSLENLLEDENGCIIRLEMLKCKRKRVTVKLSKTSLRQLEEIK